MKREIQQEIPGGSLVFSVTFDPNKAVEVVPMTGRNLASITEAADLGDSGAFDREASDKADSGQVDSERGAFSRVASIQGVSDTEDSGQGALVQGQGRFLAVSGVTVTLSRVGGQPSGVNVPEYLELPEWLGIQVTIAPPSAAMPEKIHSETIQSKGNQSEEIMLGMEQSESTIPAIPAHGVIVCPVTEIERKAFLSKKQLRSVTLPKSISKLGDWAFAYCDHLREIRLQSFPELEKAVFLECKDLQRLMIPARSQGECSPTIAALLAAVAPDQEAAYLLDLQAAGSHEWMRQWDARMAAKVSLPDMEGYSKQVLCGEEDYGSTDQAAYCKGRQQEKANLIFLRLIYDEGMPEALKEDMIAYLKACDQTWPVIHRFHGNHREYYEKFAQLGFLSEENKDRILADIGEEFPEMKAFFLNSLAKTASANNENLCMENAFFAGLDL